MIKYKNTKQIHRIYFYLYIIKYIQYKLQAKTFAYDTLGRRTSLSMPNGTTTSYSYDSLSRLTSLSTLNSSLSTINSFAYTYDNVGNKLSKQDLTETNNYTYDPTYQLSQVTTPTTNAKGKPVEKKLEIYTYDSVGNRLAGPKQNHQYTNNANNQITQIQNPNNQIQNTTYTYDNNGNRYIETETNPDGVTTTTYYSYDYEGRLTRVEIRKGNLQKEITYTYDPFGRKISKTIHKEEIDADGNETDLTLPRTTFYVYDNEDIILEYNQKGKITASYTHGLGIDEPLAFTNKKGETYFYHADGLGSVVALSDVNGTVVQTYDYDSFGNVKKKGNINQPYAFTGREFDKETGMYFYRERSYDQKTGTFISKDPIGFDAGDTNLYRYVKNNPVNYIDPLGLYGKDVHYDLTYQLALQAGFTEHDARAIAKYNQGTDDSFFTAWYYPFGGIQMHFKSNESIKNKLDGGASEVSNWACLGEALHMLQDSHSHAGYEWYKLGHLKDGTNPDKFSIFSKRDILMIYETWAYLIKYRQIYYKTGKESK